MNFEGGDMSKMEEMSRKVMGDLLNKDSVWTMGYPEFIAKLCTAQEGQ